MKKTFLTLAIIAVSYYSYAQNTFPSTGNVGIGTTSPLSGGGAASWLTLNGTVSYSGGNIYSISGVTKGYSYVDGDGLLTQQAVTGQKFVVNNTTTALSITTSGNVGIGTTAPGASLDINGSTNGMTLLRAGSGNYSSAFFYASDTQPGGVNTTRKVMQLGSGGTGGYSYGQQWYLSEGKNGGAAGNGSDRYTNQLIFSTATEADGYSATSNVMTLLGSGYVGIGTTSPSWPLVVKTGTNHNLSINDAGGVSSHLFSFNDANNAYTDLALDGANLILQKYSGGNVGIGTATPGASLDINGSTNGMTLFKAGSGNYSSAFFYASDTQPGGVNTTRKVMQLGSGGTGGYSYGQQWYLSEGKNGGAAGNGSDRYTNQLIFSTATEADGYSATSNIMTLLGSGNVGIGTTTPDTKLAVLGTIHANEVKVDLSVPGPDYVFDTDYKLANLSELKDYVDKNHHLPEIPSAKQMAKDGLNLGDMNTKLLKKVEELTLYLIEKDKQVTEQQKVTLSQQEQINQLKEQLNTITKALTKN